MPTTNNQETAKEVNELLKILDLDNSFRAAPAPPEPTSPETKNKKSSKSDNNNDGKDKEIALSTLDKKRLELIAALSYFSGLSKLPIFKNTFSALIERCKDGHAAQSMAEIVSNGLDPIVQRKLYQELTNLRNENISRKIETSYGSFLVDLLKSSVKTDANSDVFIKLVLVPYFKKIRSIAYIDHLDKLVNPDISPMELSLPSAIAFINICRSYTQNLFQQSQAFKVIKTMPENVLAEQAKTNEQLAQLHQASKLTKGLLESLAIEFENNRNSRYRDTDDNDDDTIVVDGEKIPYAEMGNFGSLLVIRLLAIYTTEEITENEKKFKEFFDQFEKPKLKALSFFEPEDKEKINFIEFCLNLDGKDGDKILSESLTKLLKTPFFTALKSEFKHLDKAKNFKTAFKTKITEKGNDFKVRLENSIKSLFNHLNNPFIKFITFYCCQTESLFENERYLYASLSRLMDNASFVKELENLPHLKPTVTKLLGNKGQKSREDYSTFRENLAECLSNPKERMELLNLCKTIKGGPHSYLMEENFLKFVAFYGDQSNYFFSAEQQEKIISGLTTLLKYPYFQSQLNGSEFSELKGNLEQLSRTNNFAVDFNNFIINPKNLVPLSKLADHFSSLQTEPFINYALSLLHIDKLKAESVQAVERQTSVYLGSLGEPCNYQTKKVKTQPDKASTELPPQKWDSSKISKEEFKLLLRRTGLNYKDLEKTQLELWSLLGMSNSKEKKASEVTTNKSNKEARAERQKTYVSALISTIVKRSDLNRFSFPLLELVIKFAIEVKCDKKDLGSLIKVLVSKLKTQDGDVNSLAQVLQNALTFSVSVGNATATETILAKTRSYITIKLLENALTSSAVVPNNDAAVKRIFEFAKSNQLKFDLPCLNQFVREKTTIRDNVSIELLLNYCGELRIVLSPDVCSGFAALALEKHSLSKAHHAYAKKVKNAPSSSPSKEKEAATSSDFSSSPESKSSPRTPKEPLTPKELVDSGSHARKSTFGDDSDAPKSSASLSVSFFGTDLITGVILGSIENTLLKTKLESNPKETVNNIVSETLTALQTTPYTHCNPFRSIIIETNSSIKSQDAKKEFQRVVKLIQDYVVPNGLFQDEKDKETFLESIKKVEETPRQASTRSLLPTTNQS